MLKVQRSLTLLLVEQLFVTGSASTARHAANSIQGAATPTAVEGPLSKEKAKQKKRTGDETAEGKKEAADKSLPRRHIPDTYQAAPCSAASRLSQPTWPAPQLPPSYTCHPHLTNPRGNLPIA